MRPRKVRPGRPASSLDYFGEAHEKPSPGPKGELPLPSPLLSV